MTTHQIWTYHVTLNKNFKNVYIKVLGKITKFGEIGSRRKSFMQKTKLRVENILPLLSAYRVKAGP